MSSPATTAGLTTALSSIKGWSDVSKLLTLDEPTHSVKLAVKIDAIPDSAIATLSTVVRTAVSQGWGFPCNLSDLLSRKSTAVFAPRTTPTSIVASTNTHPQQGANTVAVNGTSAVTGAALTTDLSSIKGWSDVSKLVTLDEATHSLKLAVKIDAIPDSAIAPLSTVVTTAVSKGWGYPCNLSDLLSRKSTSVFTPRAVTATATATATKTPTTTPATTAASAPAPAAKSAPTATPAPASAPASAPAAKQAPAKGTQQPKSAATAPAKPTTTVAPAKPAHQGPTIADLSYDGKHPPFSLLALAHLIPGITTQADEKTTTSTLTVNATQDRLAGTVSIARYLARVHDASSPSFHLYGNSALESSQIDFWLDLSRFLQDKDAISTHLDSINAHLSTRTTLVGYDLTIADLISWDCILSNPRWLSISKQLDKYVHIIRWHQYVNAHPITQVAVEHHAHLKTQVAAKKLESSSTGSYKVDLPGAEMGKVCTRFPPEPSGYLHIGHAKAALLNYYIAKEFKGQMILRFDDTNPKKEKEEFVDNIIADLKTLGITWDRLTHTSDYFDTTEKYAEQMLREGKAYLDKTPVEQMRYERMHGIESKYRNNSIEENIRLWKLMLLGEGEGLECVMRGKIDMQAKNKTLRDPSFYRCNLTPHHRTGTKYKAYPTYDFACPIVDSIEGVTHPLRTNEYHDRDEQFYWVISALRIRKPTIRDYSRLNFKYTCLSKRKLQWFVDTKQVDGWNDPRFPTVQGIIRRGMTVEALTNFIRSQGFSTSVNLMEWDKIWTLNKQVIDPIAPRYNAVGADHRVKFILTNIPDKQVAVSVPLHPKNPEVGTKHVVRSRTLYIEQDDARAIVDKEEVTLMSWGNAIVTSITKQGDLVTCIEATYNKDGNPKTTDKKLNWVGDAECDLVALELVEFDHLLTVPKVEEDMEFESIIAKKTRFETLAWGESALRNTQKGSIIQLQRRGFFIVDRVYKSATSPMVLFLIPDGKQKAMSTLSSKVEKTKEADKPTKNKEPKQPKQPKKN